MASKTKKTQSFNIVCVGQSGRLQYEALILAASLEKSSPNFSGRLIVAEPQPNELWDNDPRMNADIRERLEELGAEVIPFESKYFGQSYPNGNKIECLSVLPENEPFLFLDTDTVITGDIQSVPFDFDKPSASMNREGTWPVEELYWDGYAAVWKGLYDRFDLDFETSIDQSQPDEHWERYLYFNAGWFFYKDPKAFGERFLHYALEIRDNTPQSMEVQPIYPWLDQIALPLVIHSFGGGRPGPELDGMDGEITVHYRFLPLLFAKASDAAIDVVKQSTSHNRTKKLLKNYEPALRMIFQKRGEKARALFDQENLPARERMIRGQLRKNGYWIR